MLAIQSKSKEIYSQVENVFRLRKLEDWAEITSCELCPIVNLSDLFPGTEKTKIILSLSKVFRMWWNEHVDKVDAEYKKQQYLWLHNAPLVATDFVINYLSPKNRNKKRPRICDYLESHQNYIYLINYIINFIVEEKLKLPESHHLSFKNGKARTIWHFYKILTGGLRVWAHESFNRSIKIYRRGEADIMELLESYKEEWKKQIESAMFSLIRDMASEQNLPFLYVRPGNFVELERIARKYITVLIEFHNLPLPSMKEDLEWMSTLRPLIP